MSTNWSTRKDGDTGAWTRATIGDFDQSPSITSNRTLLGVAANLECNTEYDFRLSVRGERPHHADAFGPALTLENQRTGSCRKDDEITNVVTTVEPDCLTVTWSRPTDTRWTGFRVTRYVFEPISDGANTTAPVQEVIHERVNDSGTRFRDCSNLPDEGYRQTDHRYSYLIEYLRRVSGGSALEEGPALSTSVYIYQPEEYPFSPRNLRLTTDTRFRRTMTWETPPNHWLTAHRAFRGELRRGNVTDPWTNGFQVEQGEYTADSDGVPNGFPSQWETVRSGENDDTSTRYTDNEDRGTKLYVYRVRTTNANGRSSEYSDDYLWDAPVVFVDPGEAGQDGTPSGTGETGENTPATGAPTITGTAQVGETLTASTTSISDEDGIDNAVFTYHWVRVDSGTETDIAGTTGSTYNLLSADQGKTVRVRVSFTDDASNPETLTSAETSAVIARPNSPATGEPTIIGTARVGETLMAETSGIADEDELTNVSYGYQWLAGGSDITGATGSSHTLTSSEQGQTIQVRVSFTDNADNEETLTSASTAAVAPKPNSPATGQPTTSGTTQVGKTLEADTSGIGDADGMDTASFAYQWLADDTDISGATGSTYTLVSGDQGKSVKVRVSFTDDAGNDESLTSVATDAVAAKPTPLTASFSNVPATHNGSAKFTFDLSFSENVKAGYERVRDDAFTIVGGDILKAQRKVQGSNIGWTITVKPDGNGAVYITLPETTDCNATGAICTYDERALSHSTPASIAGPQ